ncbi:MAG: hypothetical protein QNJ47_10450 [Nostocaceae cyanobacterium]|nr:hypothetical protein [Nostocaceae cyanobacterium]
MINKKMLVNYQKSIFLIVILILLPGCGFVSEEEHTKLKSQLNSLKETIKEKQNTIE